MEVPGDLARRADPRLVAEGYGADRELGHVRASEPGRL
jgi:hypothetical protein